MIKFSRKQLRIPYLVFLLVFVVLPLFVILYYALRMERDSLHGKIFVSFLSMGKPWELCFTAL